jgi:hypothetical protein
MENNWIKFSFCGLATRLNSEGVEKKYFTNAHNSLGVKHGDITETTIVEGHKGFAYRTGKVSGITVYDFDIRSEYDRIVKAHPELEECYTVSTNKGYHIYFNYDGRITGKSGAMVDYDGVDTRNDMNIIYAPPTKYKLLDGNTARYKLLGGKLIDVPQYMIDGLKQFQTAKKQPTATKQHATKVEAVVGNVVKYTIQQLESLVLLLDAKRADSYDSWIAVGILLHKYNNSKESLELWERFSKQSKKYEKGCCVDKWNGFGNKYDKLTIGTLKYFARMDNPTGYALLEDMFGEVDHFETFDINQRYILSGPHEQTIRDQMLAWYNSENKLFAIKSAYDTGKTKTLHWLIEHTDAKRILIIVYRQTLAHNFYGGFKDYNVANYLDDDYKSDRLICQLESLPKLLGHNIFTGTYVVPGYDLVIIDESESVLNHTESPTIKCKSNTFEIVNAILKKSSKIVALDGDFGNRSYDYFKTLNNNEDFVVVRNKCVPYVKTWKFTNDEKAFSQKIVSAVEAGKKIFICSMSSEQAMRYEDMMLTECKCKVLLHSSKSDDGLKEKLQDVNALWVKYDVVIITPTVEAGVDFNVEHFDQMFTILSSKSTSQRGLLQMTARVRRLKNLDNEVYLNHIPFSTSASLYTYDEVDVMYNIQQLSDNLQLDDDNNLSNNNPFTNISKHNYLETLNKNKTYFVPYLTKLLKRKGQQYSFDGTDCKPTKGEPKGDEEKEDNINYTIQSIFNADQVCAGSYQILCKHQNTNKATEGDKYAIERYLYCHHWNISQKDLTIYDLTCIFRRTGALFNQKALMGEEVKSFCTDGGRDKDVDVKVRNKKLKYINEMLRMLEFKDADNKFIVDKVVDAEDFAKLSEKALDKCTLFADPTVRALFEMRKKDPATTKAFLGYANQFLKNYGVKIQSKSVGSGKKNKKKLCYTICYILPTFTKTELPKGLIPQNKGTKDTK